MSTNCLDSGWWLKGYIGEDWRWRDAHLPETRDPDNWIKATVPGSVHYDLWRAGLIADPYRGQNTLLAEWVSARTWVYRNRFAVDAALEGPHRLAADAQPHREDGRLDVLLAQRAHAHGAQGQRTGARR